MRARIIGTKQDERAAVGSRGEMGQRVRLLGASGEQRNEEENGSVFLDGCVSWSEIPLYRQGPSDRGREKWRARVGVSGRRM